MHLFLRNPPGEIVVKVGDRLAQRPAVQPRHQERADIGADHHRLIERKATKDDGPEHQQKDDGPADRPAMRGDKAWAFMRRGGIDDQAQNEHGRRFDDSRRNGDANPKNDHGPCAAQVPAEEGPEGVWRCTFGAIKRVDDIGGPADQAVPGLHDHSAASCARKPPDCRDQSRA